MKKEQKIRLTILIVLYAAYLAAGILLAVTNSHCRAVHGIADAALELVCRQPHLSRAKRDFLADRGAKELRIGILEHKAHALMEPLGNRGILKICRIDRMPVKQIRARVRELKAVDKAHDRRLAAAVGT